MLVVYLALIVPECFIIKIDDKLIAMIALSSKFANQI